MKRSPRLLRKMRKTEVAEPRLSPVDPARVRLNPLEPQGARAADVLAVTPLQEVG